MRHVVITLTIFSFLALGSCDKLAKAFEDIQEEAPGICKKDCAEKFDCFWGEGYDVSGDKESAARNEAENECIARCAWPINYGAYVYKTDYDDGDYEIEYVDHISGAKYEKYFKCIFELKECDHDYWGLKDDIWDDEDDCEEFAACVEILGIDYEYKWEEEEDYYYEDDYETCVGDGDEYVDGLEGGGDYY
jgi:hypothetical protein